MRELSARQDTETMNALLRSLADDLVYTSTPNFKKGGMIALAAAAIALGPVCFAKHFI